MFPNPEDEALSQLWREFEVWGVNLQYVDVTLNAAGSTGSLVQTSVFSPASVGDTCSAEPAEGFIASVGQRFHMAGCDEGTTIIHLLDHQTQRLLRTYRVHIDLAILPAIETAQPQATPSATPTVTPMAVVPSLAPSTLPPTPSPPPTATKAPATAPGGQTIPFPSFNWWWLLIILLLLLLLFFWILWRRVRQARE